MHESTILYAMPVSWGWIAQRPHYLALELEKQFDLAVVYPRAILRTFREQQKTPQPRKCIRILQIPFQERNRLLRFLSKLIFRLYTGGLDRYDILWLGSPFYYRMIPEGFRGIVVFDLMDDVVAMQRTSSVAGFLRKDYRRLVKRADHIFATSMHLYRRIPDKYRGKASLLRNGCCGGSIREVKPTMRRDMYHIGYVGTIAAWMDVSSIRGCLERFPDITWHFWGPAEAELPRHERIRLHGVIEHEEIADAVAGTDCLIMPFRKEPLVLAVDPVKIYEYVGFGKCIISVHYPEVEHFSPFVWFYDDTPQLLQLLDEMRAAGFPAKYTSDAQRRFLAENTWAQRAAEAAAVLEQLK